MASSGRRAKPADDDRLLELMRAALAEARRAGARGEVPVGAVVVVDDQVVGRAGNDSIRACDPTGHAEVRALRKAARKLGSYRLVGATVVVTLEPCLMCMGAMVQARIARLVFGATDPKAGAAVSLYQVAEDGRLNHRFEVVGGIEEHAGREILREFFRRRRREPNR